MVRNVKLGGGLSLISLLDHARQSELSVSGSLPSEHAHAQLEVEVQPNVVLPKHGVFRQTIVNYL